MATLIIMCCFCLFKWGVCRHIELDEAAGKLLPPASNAGWELPHQDLWENKMMACLEINVHVSLVRSTTYIYRPIAMSQQDKHKRSNTIWTLSILSGPLSLGGICLSKMCSILQNEPWKLRAGTWRAPVFRWRMWNCRHWWRVLLRARISADLLKTATNGPDPLLRFWI